jgi:hypothetical protein
LFRDNTILCKILIVDTCIFWHWLKIILSPVSLAINQEDIHSFHLLQSLPWILIGFPVTKLCTGRHPYPSQWGKEKKQS